MNYCQDRNTLLEKKWTDQSSRFNKKLLPESFRIDEKTVSDFAAFASDYGKLISFFNLNDRPDGDWSSFFRDDATISLMFLQSLATDRWSDQSAEILLTAEKAKTERTKLNALKELVVLSTQIFSEIEKAASTIHPYKDFHTQLIKYIQVRLSPFFLVLNETSKLLREYYEWRNPLATNFDISFGSYWFPDKTFNFSDTSRWTEAALQHIGTHLPKLIRDVVVLKKETHAFLNEEVLKSGNIKPHIALFIAFCELYEHAQRKLNAISERHLKHYYEEILNLEPQAGNRDSVYVTFNLGQGAGSLQLTQENKLIHSSKKTGLSEYFVLDHPTPVHEGSIAKMMGINVSPQPWLGSFMNRRASEVSVFDLHYPGKNNYALGFEIASQYLVLEEGDRRITFDFFLDRMEVIRLKETVLSSFFPFELEKLNALIAGAWSVAYSNPEGMQPVDEKSLGLYFHGDPEQGFLKLRFDILIKKHELPCVSLNPDDPTQDALLRFTLNQKGAPLYALFRDLSFSRASLDIAVIGVRDLLLQNDFGLLENGHPFEPFGPRPALGSNLFIGHRNLFLKPLKELIINLEWNNLPLDEHGFKEYYKAYEGIENNASFKVALSSLKDKNWLPPENRQVLDLFTGIDTDTSREDNPLATIRRLNEIDLQSLGLNSESRITGPLTGYDLSSTDGFIKLELCYPEAAFGHDQYTELVQKMAFKAVKDKKEPELVNEPYTPSLKSISLEYKAGIEIRNWNEKITLKKIHPFGTEDVNSQKNWSFLPHFPNGGSFFIGMEPVLSDKEVSFLVKVSNQNIHRNSNGSKGFGLSILKGSEWVALSDDRISNDATKNLQRTGLLKIQLPDIDPLQNSIDGQNLWLRFDLADAHTGYYIEDIHLNAALASRENLLKSDSEPVPERNIVSLKDPLIQIEKIEQPYKSFNGRNPESLYEFRLRASERLRHKARAVSNQDIEQLLLAKFPEIQSLKVLNHFNADLRFQPGATSVVAIPVENEESDALERYFAREKLQLFQDYLNVRSLSGMKISVINPVYEKIRLKFNVKFREAYDEKLAFKKLHHKIIHFLDPWKSYKIISQGGVIPITTILNEIELEEYVDFVTNFSVFHVVNDKIINLGTAPKHHAVIRASSPVSVLIPDVYHKLLPFNDKMLTDKPGINDMMIGNDFLVNETLSNASSGLGFDTIEKTFRLSPGKSEISGEKHTFTLYLKG